MISTLENLRCGSAHEFIVQPIRISSELCAGLGVTMLVKWRRAWWRHCFPLMGSTKKRGRLVVRAYGLSLLWSVCWF